jgi:uncharacterized protein YndB with AHSA1/START domain
MAERSETDFVLERVFRAPRALVWKAWTEPERVAAWYGPRGFRGRCEIDLRIGGIFCITMIAADGVEYPMKGVYREIVAPERLVYSGDLSGHPEAWHDLIDPERDRTKGRPAYETLTTVTFEERGDETRMILRVRFESQAVRDRFVKLGMNDGWQQSFERLEERTEIAEREIAATRVLNAPRELVWKMWTDPEHIKHWWGPNGFTTTIHRMEVRPDGVWEFVMHGPDGVDYQNRVVYQEIVEPERIVYAHVSGPRFQMIVTFADHGKQTRLSVRMRFDSAAARDEVARRFGAVEGLEQTLGRLGERLAASV